MSRTRKLLQRGTEEIMSDSPVFDRRKGFVALPVDVLDLDLSPGAFRLLVELCRMANLDGFCWPSLGQLGDRLGRSKAAVSGYLQDLRDAALITTEEQRTANGYNYRLRYCVTFWKAWRASLTGKVTAAPSPQKTESRVRQDERLRKTKNQSPENHDLGGSQNLDDLISAWSSLAKGAPYPALKGTPKPNMIARTQAVLAADPPPPCANIAKQAATLWHQLGLQPDPTAADIAARHLLLKGFSRAEFDQVTGTLSRSWPAHWRKIPTSKQLDQLLTSARITTHSARIKVLSSYLKRWERTQNRLRTPPMCETLTQTAEAAPCPAASTYIRGYG